jgi:hypothetical protein
MAGALNDLASTTKTRGPSRDTQYKATGRNTLGKIVTMDKLDEATRGLHKIKKSIVEGMGVDMKGTLSSLCWSNEKLELFMLVGRLPLMSRLSLELFQQLLMNFQRIAFSQGNGWDLAKVDLDSFAEALQDIRTAAPTRLMLIVKTYAFLRDAVASGFSNAQLTDARHTYTMTTLASLKAAKPGVSQCPHCGQVGLHPAGHSGGQSECLFSSLTRPTAKKAARDAVDKMLADPTLMLVPTCIAAVHAQNI